METVANLERFRGKYLSLTSFKRDGTGVPTPVGFGVAGEELYFMTNEQSWKVKRLSRNPRVAVAARTLRGTVDRARAAGSRPAVGRRRGRHSQDQDHRAQSAGLVPAAAARATKGHDLAGVRGPSGRRLTITAS